MAVGVSDGASVGVDDGVKVSVNVGNGVGVWGGMVLGAKATSCLMGSPDGLK